MCKADIFYAPGQPIRAWEAWPRPKLTHQWAEGFSAMELARAWFRSGKVECPREFSAILGSHPLTSKLERLRGCAEYVTSLPMAGEGRNHDMWLTGISERRGVTITVEAKGQETFGNPIGVHIAAAEASNPETGTGARAAALFEVLLGRTVDPQSPPYSELYYQLLTAFAGTCLQASRDGNSLAVLIVYEFTGPHLDQAKQTKNTAALSTFIDTLAGSPVRFELGKLTEPIRVPAGEMLEAPIDLLVGKVVTPVAPRRGAL